MPKKMLADVDDIVQIRARWEELLATAYELGWKRSEIAAVVDQWSNDLVEEA